MIVATNQVRVIEASYRIVSSSSKQAIDIISTVYTIVTSGISLVMIDSHFLTACDYNARAVYFLETVHNLLQYQNRYPFYI